MLLQQPSAGHGCLHQVFFFFFTQIRVLLKTAISKCRMRRKSTRTHSESLEQLLKDSLKCPNETNEFHFKKNGNEMVTERKRRRKLPRVKTIELPTSKQTRATSLNHSFVFFFFTKRDAEPRGRECDRSSTSWWLITLRQKESISCPTDIYGLLQLPPNRRQSDCSWTEPEWVPVSASRSKGETSAAKKKKEKKKGQYVLRHVHRHVLCMQKANTNSPDEAAYQSTLNNPEQEPAKRKLLDEQTHHCL